MQVLKAGNIEVSYDRGFLRYFKAGDTEVLRMIYFAVRNANWENVEPVICNELINSDENSFRISYVAGYSIDHERIFDWNVLIEGFPDGQIAFEISGEGFREFRTNRAGFCILHPITHLAGEPVTVTHSDRSAHVYEFPETIAPHQPFIDITAMQWKVNGNTFDLKFEGDIFEIEDQRNWGDASYKTYCTPLSLPFPKTVYPGDKIYQKVVFTYAPEKIPTETTPAPKVFFNQKLKIGTAIPSDADRLSALCIDKLKGLRLDHFSLEVWPATKHWEADLARHIETAGTLGGGLELVLYLSPDFQHELGLVLDMVSGRGLDVQTLTLLSQDELVTSPEMIDYIPKLKKRIPAIPIGVGTRYNFTELNRNRFDAGRADFIALSFDPQEHASDDLTIMENAETLTYIAESIRAFFRKPVHFSPVLLKRRYNPYATEAPAIAIPFEKQKDPRQKTAFLSQWVDSLFVILRHSDIASVTLFQAVGELGLMDENGHAYPVYETLKDHAARNQ